MQKFKISGPFFYFLDACAGSQKNTRRDRSLNKLGLHAPRHRNYDLMSDVPVSVFNLINELDKTLYESEM